jgi:hypothetical protein
MATYLEDIRQGDDYVIKVDFGSDNNITGFEFWITLKQDFEQTDAQAVLQFTTVAGDDTADDPTHGIAYIRIPAATTKAIDPSSYIYDVQVKTTTGSVQTIIPPNSDYTDRVKVIPEVTKAIV